MNKKAILEGLLFLNGHEGLDVENIKLILNLEEEEVLKLVESLKNDYEQDDRGIRLEVLGESLKLTTKKEHKEYYEKLVEIEKNSELTQASLETLAIIAYNQPITRVKVDEIRGVECSYIIRKLVSMNLIREVGRAETPGRPRLYETTKQFLDHFGLANISLLPSLEMNDIVEIDETDLFESKYKEQ